MNFIKQKKDLDLNHIVDPSKDCIKYIKSSKEKKFTSHLYGDSIIRSDFKNYLISILFNTNNIEKTVSILKKFLEKTAHPEKIQFCIKIDNDDTTFVDSFLKEISKFEFNFIILSSPRGRGFIDLWQWINFLFKVSSKYSKFVMNISDEMYVDQKNWDKNLEHYIGLESDNIFRLRTSVYKNRNYKDLYECAYAPDTTAIYTRKYLTIQKDFCPCFGPDNGQQIVSYYLSKINYPRHYQYLRDKVINDISFSGQGTNVGLDKNSLIKRRNLNHQLWLSIFKYENQIEYYKRARKLQVEILKNNFPSINIKDNGKEYIIFSSALNYKKEKYFIKIRLSYSNLSKIKLILYNLVRYDFFKYNTGYAKLKLQGILVTIYFLLFNRFPNNKTLKGKSSSQILYEKYEIYSGLVLINKFKEKIFISKKRSKFKKIISIEILFPILHFIIFYIFIVLIPIMLIIDIKNFISNFSYIYNIIRSKYFRKYHYLKSHVFLENKFDQSKTIIVKGD